MSKKVGTEIKCSCCGKVFVFTDDEKVFYDSKGLQTPKKCYSCRNIAKIARKETIGLLKKYGIIQFVDNTVAAEDETEGA
jgi:hypothetical protein